MRRMRGTHALQHVELRGGDGSQLLLGLLGRQLGDDVERHEAGVRRVGRCWRVRLGATFLEHVHEVLVVEATALTAQLDPVTRQTSAWS